MRLVLEAVVVSSNTDSEGDSRGFQTCVLVPHVMTGLVAASLSKLEVSWDGVVAGSYDFRKYNNSGRIAYIQNWYLPASPYEGFVAEDEKYEEYILFPADLLPATDNEQRRFEAVIHSFATLQNHPVKIIVLVGTSRFFGMYLDVKPENVITFQDQTLQILNESFDLTISLRPPAAEYPEDFRQHTGWREILARHEGKSAFEVSRIDGLQSVVKRRADQEIYSAIHAKCGQATLWVLPLDHLVELNDTFRDLFLILDRSLSFPDVPATRDGASEKDVRPLSGGTTDTAAKGGAEGAAADPDEPPKDETELLTFKFDGETYSIRGPNGDEKVFQKRRGRSKAWDYLSAIPGCDDDTGLTISEVNDTLDYERPINRMEDITKSLPAWLVDLLAVDGKKWQWKCEVRIEIPNAHT